MDVQFKNYSMILSKIAGVYSAPGILYQVQRQFWRENLNSLRFARTESGGRPAIRSLGLILLAALGLLAACRPQPVAAPSADPPLRTVTLPAVTLTDTPTPQQPCAFQWANQPLPELSARLQELFDAAGLAEVTVHAAAFGENCVLPDGQVERFLPMNTDLYLEIPVEDLNDAERLGEQLKPVIETAADIPADWLPGNGQIGYLGPSFLAGEGVQRLWFPFTHAQKVLADGLTGAELIQALSAP